MISHLVDHHVGNASYAAAEERRIRDLTRQLAEAWNRNDGAAYAALFTEDGDYVAFDGTHLKGREENARHHDRLFEGVLRGTRLVYEDVSVRFLTEDVAVMHGYGSVLMPWQSTVAPRRRSLQTYVVVKQDGAWRIAAFHNTRVRPLPTGFALRLITLMIRARARFSARGRSEFEVTRPSADRPPAHD
jgi:uncharacterized protein (TIGR02246 family)